MKMWNKIFKNPRGSAAIILSLMVSGGTLSTVYITQKMAGSFFASISQSMEEWEYHFVQGSVQKMAAYLVQNNLILCREGGWNENVLHKCEWSIEDDTDNPSDFNLSNKKHTSEGRLSFTGSYKLREGNPINYRLTFHLVDWRDRSIQSFIGEIPEYICRKKSDLAIIPDATCPDYESFSASLDQPCNKAGGTAPVPGSVCEYIKAVDGDYMIVLVKVEIDYTDPKTKVEKTHTALSGIRRPLALFQIQSIMPGRQCSLACNVGRSAHFAPDCRDNFFPTDEGVHEGLASNVITVRNSGPGAIYRLKLIRDTKSMLDETSETKRDVTPDIIALAQKQALLPGETLSFEYFYNCPVIVSTETIRRTGTRNEDSTDVVNQMIPIQSVVFSFDFTQNPLGACYSSKGNTLPSALSDDDTNYVDVTLPAQRGLISEADCSKGAKSCSHAGQTGYCEYPDIEPRRAFLSAYSPPASEETSVVREIERTVILTPPPPPPRSRVQNQTTWPGGSGGGAGGN